MRLLVTKIADEYPGPFETEEEVRDFFSTLITEVDINLHPDTPFADYHNTQTGEPSFDANEADVLDDLMDRAFDWAADSGSDIYEIALEVLLQYRDAENEKKY